MRFVFIGAVPLKNSLIDIRFQPWKYDTEVQLMNEFDIGIMPLPDNEWTRGKGGCKLLQYMAIGIPSIASPVGINEKLIKDGDDGFLAPSQEEWINKISVLVENSELRR